MPTLVIVESPGKVKTIQKYLDALWPNKYEVAASVGHIYSLNKEGLGFDKTTFEGHYIVSEDKAKVVQNLHRLKNRSQDVILATDIDREGEAIAYHLAKELDLKNPDRIAFNEITKDTIAEAIKSPIKINIQKVHAQETRRILDRMIGWMVSPVTRSYVVAEGSAGRVQTVVVLIIVLQERRILEFKPTKHFNVSAFCLNTEKDPAVVWSVDWNYKSWLKPTEKYWTDRAVAQKVQGIKSLVVESINIGEATNSPSAPLITSTLQRAAEISLGLTPKETMDIAQKLYEAGAITYMRTDNPNLSADAFIALKSFALANDLPIEANQRTFPTKKGAQEAHEAIRPTSFAFQPSKLQEGKSRDLYEMIWSRAVASQLKAARYDTKDVVLSQNVEVTINGETSVKKAVFHAKGRRLTYAGWRDLNKKDFTEIEEEDRDLNNDLNNLIPERIKVGDTIEVKDAQLLERTTEPPRRFSQAGLIAELERLGIGRPSTYASLLGTILSRGFIRHEKKKIIVTDVGFKLIDKMKDHFEFIDVKYTAAMEEELDQIEAGAKEHKPILKNFFTKIGAEVDAFEKHIITTLPQHKCELCSSLVIQRNSSERTYWKCSNKECNAVYADKNGTPGPRQVSKVTTQFNCLECDRPLTYSKGMKDGREYEFFSCSGRADKINPCFAKYEPAAGVNPAAPDFEAYKEKTKHKCLLCYRPVLKGSVEKDGVAFTYWRCSANIKNEQLCTAFYEDKEGEPDFEAFKLNHQYKCKVCDNFLTRRKSKDKDGYYWSCGHEIKKGEFCRTFYLDADKAPDFEEYQKRYLLNHTHKCQNGACQEFLSYRQYKNSEDHFWKCGGCNSFYDDLNQAPDFEKFQAQYIANHTHNCVLEGCGGFLAKRHSAKQDMDFWICDTCEGFYQDLGGEPNIEIFKENHTHKCFNCDSYLTSKLNITKVKSWYCSNKSCSIAYKHDSANDCPDIDLAKDNYPHECSACSKGRLKRIINAKTKLPQWACSNYEGCGKYFDDEDGVPAQKGRKPRKS